jgi:hypothetical protein
VRKTYHSSTRRWNMKNYKKRNNIKHFHSISDVFSKQTPHYIHSNRVSHFTHENVQHDDDQVLKRSLVATMYEYLSEDEPEMAATDNCNDDSLQKRVNEIVDGGSEKLKSSWMSRLHFVNQSVLELGDFIPLVLSRWYCSGHGCGLDQVAVEGKEGFMIFRFYELLS